MLTVLFLHLLAAGAECMGSGSGGFTETPESSPAPGGTICSDGWLPFEGSCYLFGHNAMAFTAAENFCRQHHNSHLIHVNNAKENEFIKDRLRELIPKNWWIGITDESIEGLWKWFDTDEDAVFSDWYPGQDHTTYEDCAIFWQPVGFKWADYSCIGQFYPICETRGNTCDGTMTIFG